MVGIVDTLFVVVIALLGLQVMSASTLGFEELELKQVLARVGLAFLGANTSIFMVEWLIQGSNTLVKTVLDATGGLEHAWVFTAMDPASLIDGTAALITLLFLIIFMIVAVVLLLFFISRLIIVALGAAVAPVMFLLWAFPKGADFAEVSLKTYLVVIYSVFVQVIILQLASAFLSIEGQTSPNSLISILVAIGLFLVLLKTPSTLSSFVFYTTSSGMLKNVAGKLMNVASASSRTTQVVSTADVGVTAKRISLKEK